MKNQSTSELFDNFAEQTIKITTEALAEKDQIIKDLQKKLATCTCQKETKNA